LDILPTINPDGYVNLQVQQEISAATNQIQFGAPVISTREASASLFVKDGQTVVLGGLTDTQEQKIRTGIPGLSSIPLIGGLFGSTKTSSTRTELFLFLTPHVVHADDDIDRIRDAIRERAKLLQGVPTTPYIDLEHSGATPGKPSGSGRSDSTSSSVKAIPLQKRP
jgi:general secretion pathway protein D